MRTKTYNEKIRKISFFCDNAKDGFVVVEVNDLITKNEILFDLSKKNNAIILSNMDANLSDLRTNAESRVIIVDTIVKGNSTKSSEEWAININYNRDLLADIGCVIFVCTTTLVNKLISFSSSFWSFVAIHLAFNEKLECIYYPIYIETEHFYVKKGTIAEWRESISDYIKSDSELRYFFSYHSVSSSTNNLTNILDTLSGKVNDCVEYYKHIKKLGETLYNDHRYEKAEICYKSIIDHNGFEDISLKLKIDLYNSLASVYYNLENYHSSLWYLNIVRAISEKNSELFSICDISILWNNIGVLFLVGEENDLDNAISCLHESLSVLDNENDGIIFSQILYNACLMNYQYGDYKQSKYYIELANQFIDSETRTHSIMRSRFSVIKAFIMLNEGNFSDIIDLMSNSLRYLRKELNEKHVYILEAHYTFALIYMHLDMIDNADKCITKAIEIVKEIKPNRSFKFNVWLLYGIVKYYLLDYNKAKNYLSLAFNNQPSRNKANTNVFDYLFQELNLRK